MFDDLRRTSVTTADANQSGSHGFYLTNAKGLINHCGKCQNVVHTIKFNHSIPWKVSEK